MNIPPELEALTVGAMSAEQQAQVLLDLELLEHNLLWRTATSRDPT